MMRSSRTLAVALALVVFLAAETGTQAARVHNVHHVRFPFTYSQMGNGASFWFHVPEGLWNVEARIGPKECSPPPHKETVYLAVTGTNGYQVVVFLHDRSGGLGTRWSGWSANLVTGTYRDDAIQVRPGCWWWIRFTYNSTYR